MTRGQATDTYRWIMLKCGCRVRFRCPLPHKKDTLWCYTHHLYTNRK